MLAVGHMLREQLSLSIHKTLRHLNLHLAT